MHGMKLFQSLFCHMHPHIIRTNKCSLCMFFGSLPVYKSCDNCVTPFYSINRLRVGKNAGMVEAEEGICMRWNSSSRKRTVAILLGCLIACTTLTANATDVQMLRLRGFVQQQMTISTTSEGSILVHSDGARYELADDEVAMLRQQTISVQNIAGTTKLNILSV